MHRTITDTIFYEVLAPISYIGPENAPENYLDLIGSAYNVKSTTAEESKGHDRNRYEISAADAQFLEQSSNDKQQQALNNSFHQP